MEILEDKFGRVHDYLRISLTDKCNLRCTYCMPADPSFMPSDRLMNSDELVSIAKIFTQDFGISKIRLTGGEPLVRKDCQSILKGLSGLTDNLRITTNGVLLHRYFDSLKTAGVKSLTVSLDTLKQEKFKKIALRDDFEIVWKNIIQAHKSGFRIKLNCVVSRGMNEDEILDFVRLTREYPFHVRFIEFMPFQGNKWHWEKVVSYREMLDKIAAVYPIRKLQDLPNSTSKAWQVDSWEGTFAVISTITEHFCGNCNRIRLTADGKIRNCLFSRNETDLLTAFRAGEDIRPLIRNTILKKHEKLGGLPEFQDEDALKEKLSDRSMVRIGG